MKLKILCSIYLLACIFRNGATDGLNDDDLSDFDFVSINQTDQNQDQNRSSFEDPQNGLEEDEETEEEKSVVQELKFSKEMFVREVIFNSMKSEEMKEKIARILPILRAMTPEQKLALASLVTSQILTPVSDSRTLTLDEVTGLFGNNPNTTAELMLPISLDVANMFRQARSEKGPTAEELRAAPYKRIPNFFRRNIIERAHNKYYRPRKPGKNNNSNSKSKEMANCELFSSGICLNSPDYPLDAIMTSIRRNKHAVGALLTDFKGMSATGSVDGMFPDQEYKSNANEEDGDNEVRRTGAESGFMCPSVVRYARPQKARSTSGQWKYIVNTKDHTQTLRLEKCTKPGETCTYLTDNYKSRCVQVYNYHRLLTWDQANGLHIDIFKVPSCCSCHIDSYKVPFPPHHANRATTSENFPGEEIEGHDPYAGVITHTESDQIPNIIPESNHYQQPTYQSEFPDYQETKLHSTIENSNNNNNNHRNSLPKYLEAPRPQQPYSNLNSNSNFKRSNPPKPRPVRPIRRRQPMKPVRDLIKSESNFGAAFTTEMTLTSTSMVVNSKELGKKINYNYHPIIDFFKPEQMESRMDVVDVEESGWKPVTAMLGTTEKGR